MWVIPNTETHLGQAALELFGCDLKENMGVYARTQVREKSIFLHVVGNPGNNNNSDHVAA